MRTTCFCSALFLLAFCTYPASTSEPAAQLLPPIDTVQADGKDQPKQPAKDKDKDKKPPEKKPNDPPQTDIFTQTPAPIRDALGFSPQMMGDFFGTFAVVNVPVVSTKTVTVRSQGPGQDFPTTTTTTQTTTKLRAVLVPVDSYGSLKVAENASPMPVDRVFMTFNFFGNIQGPPQASPFFSSQTTSVPGPLSPTITKNVTSIPSPPQITANLYRETFGFEKTFLDGRASVELRVPMQEEQSNVPGFSSSTWSDLTIIGKYAFYLDRTTGNVFSGGLAITAPTGPQITSIDGDFHSTLIQPWLGYIWNFDRFYLQAFHSIVVPTDERDVTLLFNDVGVNYWLYRGASDRFLSFIVPTVEAHVTTPLNQRGAGTAIYCPDEVVFTGGVHFGLFRYSTLSFGVATPITGPRLYNVEAFVQFNRRF